MKSFIQNNNYTILLIIISIMATVIISNVTHSQATETTQTKQIEEFTIIQVSDNEYYGTSTTSDSGIYFTNNELKSTVQIRQGDKIKAFFDKEDDLVRVSKVKNISSEWIKFVIVNNIW